MMNRWITGVLGLAIFLMAFVELSGITLTWSLGIIGAVLVVNSLWGITSETKRETGSRHAHGHM